MGNVEKTAEFFVGIATRALGDVVRNRERRPSQLFRITIEMPLGL
jgi:hypothetical protein